MSNVVVKTNEVVLFGTRYRIDGEVQEQAIPTFANKTVIGDVTRQDQLNVSEWNMSDWRGGMGTYDYNERDGVDSFYESTAETRVRGQLRLPRRQIASTDLGSTPTCMVSWGTLDCLAAGTTIYYYAVDSTVYGVFGSVAANITDLRVYKNNLYAAAGTAGYWYHTGAAASTITAATAYYWAEYDSKLLMLSDDGAGLIKLKSTTSATAGTADWTTNAALFTDVVGDARGLDVYVNSEGKDTPYVFTKWGVRVVDFSTGAVYRPKALQFPDGHTDNARSFTVNYGGGEGFLAKLQTVYRLSGQNVYPLTTLGEQAPRGDSNRPWLGSGQSEAGVSERLSLEPTAGLKSLYRGIVRKLLSTERYIIAVMDRKDTSNGTSFLLAWNGRGWHTLASASASMRVAHYSRSTPLGDVLWFNQGTRMYYITMPDVSDNPYMYTSADTESSASHVTAWYDGNYAEVNKLAAQAKLRKRNASGTITAYYGLDYDDSTWTSFATITAAGATALALGLQSGTQQGVVFRAVRFKFDLTGGTANDPILEFASLKYGLIPTRLRAWSFSVDLSDEYGGLQPSQLLSNLKDAETNSYLGAFSFRPDSDEVFYVKIMQRAGKELTGEQDEAHYRVSVAQWV